MILSISFYHDQDHVNSGIYDLSHHDSVQYSMYIACGILESPTSNGKGTLENYYTTLHIEFFTIFEYAHWKTVYLELLSIITRFIWQFTNYFISILSLALAARFQQINGAIRRNQVYDR